MASDAPRTWLVRGGRAVVIVAGAGLLEQGAIQRKGPERKIETVEMIPQIKDAWESRSGKFSFFPPAIRALGLQEVVNASCHRRMPYDAGVQEPQERPSGLRGGAWALAGCPRVLVGIARFAPAAVRVLMTDQPINRSPDVWLIHPLSDRSKARQHRPGAVDVINPPSAEPAPCRFLLVLEECDRALSHRGCVAPAQVAEHLEHPSGQIRRGGIEQGFVVREGALVQEQLVVILVIRASCRERV